MSTALLVKDFCLDVQVDVEILRCLLVFIFKNLSEVIRIDIGLASGLSTVYEVCRLCSVNRKIPQEIFVV